MTNLDVIRLVKLGLSADIVITKINESPANFDLSIEGLVALSQNRVPNEVIKAMQAAARQQGRASSTSPTHDGTSTAGERAANSGSRSAPYPLPPDKGAYLWDASDIHLLYQSTVPSAGTNFLRSITPFVKKKFELQLVGAYAEAQFEVQQPTILVSGLGEVIPGVPAYRLLYVKTGGMLKDRRIVGTYDVGGFFGSIRMVDNEVECEVTKIGDGIYAITPLKPLKDGEYGLVQVPKLADMSARPSFAPPIWDFGVYAEGHPSEKKY
ncbi:MAG: hypothetical protein AABO41_26535 [Acidobacteriota bacterium]